MSFCGEVNFEMENSLRSHWIQDWRSGNLCEKLGEFVNSMMNFMFMTGSGACFLLQAQEQTS